MTDRKAKRLALKAVRRWRKQDNTWNEQLEAIADQMAQDIMSEQIRDQWRVFTNMFFGGVGVPSQFLTIDESQANADARVIAGTLFVPDSLARAMLPMVTQVQRGVAIDPLPIQPSIQPD